MKLNAKRLGKTFMEEILPGIGGDITSSFVINLTNKAVAKMIPAYADKLKNFVPLAPLIVGTIMTDSKGKMWKFVGYGMAFEGGKKLAANFIPMINGIEDMELSGIFGYDELK